MGVGGLSVFGAGEPHPVPFGEIISKIQPDPWGPRVKFCRVEMGIAE